MLPQQAWGKLPCRVVVLLLLSPQSNQEMPDVMPSMDFKRVWQSSPAGAAGAGAAAGRGAARDARVSIWRPVGPPGYSSLGDVAVAGSEPPSGKPVKMYKDVLGAGGAPGQVSMDGCHDVMALQGGLGAVLPFSAHAACCGARRATRAPSA